VQLAQQPTRRFQNEEEGDEEDIELCEFEVTESEEEDIFVAKQDDILREAWEDTKNGFTHGKKQLH
jgi:hypothetical protein